MLLVKSTLVAAVIAAATGAVATAVDRSWDLFVIFAVLVVLQLGIALSLMGSRRLTTLRVDLDRWISERAAVTGEPRSRIADRSVAAYRAGLVSPDD